MNIIRSCDKKFLSIVLSLIILISCSLNTLVFSAKANDGTESYHIDFGKYNAKALESFYSADNFSIKSDASAEGGKYLSYKFTANRSESRRTYFSLSETGLPKTGTVGQGTDYIKLAGGKSYNVTVKYKLDDFTTTAGVLSLMLKPSKTTKDIVNDTDTSSSVLLETLKSSTSGWVTKTYTVSVPDGFNDGAYNILQMQILPAKSTTPTTFAASLNLGSYTLNIDYVDIKEGTEIEPVDPTVFEEEHYGINFNDFAIADVEKDDVKNGNCVSSGQQEDIYKNTWTIEEDTNGTTGKYLHRVVDAGSNWAPAHVIFLSAKGGTTDKSIIALKNSTTYSIKMRYRLNNYVSGAVGRLSLMLTHSTKITDISGWDERNAVVLDTFTESTDGWIETQYFVTMPDSYVTKSGASNGLQLALASVKEDSPKTPANSYGVSYSFDIDYINIDRTSSVQLISNDSVYDTIYGIPGETIAVTAFGTPKRTGYKFVGWYDETETVSATDVLLETKDVTKKYYALYDELITSALVNDENYPIEYRNNNALFSGFSSNSDKYSGISSFKSNSDNAYMLLNYNSSAIEVQSEGTYQMSFWYKASQNAVLSFVTSGNNSIVEGITQGEVSLDKTAEWKKGVITFTVKDSSNLFLWLKVSKFGILIDDITLAVSSSIIFETNGGERLSPLFGTPGEKAKLPTPIYSGHTFSGWFSDIECNKKVSTAKFPTNTTETVLYAGWDIKEPMYTVDFEDAPFASLGAGFNSDVMAIVDDTENVFAGDKSLYFKYTGGNGKNATASNSFIVYSPERKGVRLDDNTTYQLGFWYKVRSTNADVRVTPMTGFENNYWVTDGQVNYSGNGYTISQNTATGEWKHAVIYFTTSLGTHIYQGNPKSCNMLYFRINVLSDVDSEIYFDNVTLDKVSDNTVIISKVLSNSSNEFIECKKNATVDLGVPLMDGYDFKGWFLDKEYTQKIDGGIYKATKHTNVYAKWSLSYVVGDFENYPSTWLGPNVSGEGKNYRFDVNEGMTLESNIGTNGSKAARYVYNTAYNNKYSFFQLYNKNDITVTGDTPLCVEDGAQYKFTVKYKVNSAEANIKLSLMLGNRTNFWTAKALNPDYTISYNDAGSGWKTATLFFTSNFLKDSAGNVRTTYDSLYLKVFAGGAYTDIVFDDYSLETMEGKVYISFDPTTGENQQYAIGYPGADIGALPALTRTGYTLSGWYLDREYTKAFTGTKFGSASITLYAKWKIKNAVVSFENHYYRTTLESKYADCATVSNERASDGKYSMKADKTTNSRGNTGLIMTIDDIPVTVNDHSTYQITYDYYIVQNSTSATASWAPVPNVRISSSSTMWGKNAYNPEFNWWFSLSEETGVWKTATFTFTTALKDLSSNVLYFTVNQSPYFYAYFDNLRITEIDRSSNDYVLSLNPTGATDICGNKMYFVGKTGDTVKLPNNLKRNGYVFTGWYTNSKCSDLVKDNTFTFSNMDTTLYAGWASTGFTQTFENFDEQPKGRYYYMDFDYEIYDSSAAGNDASNVHSGKKSLHRIGNDFHNCAAQIIDKKLNQQMSINQVYKMTMWVKLESGSHSDGAVAIASNGQISYAWAIDGNWKNIIAIEDLTDNKWHEVSYTFYATSNYLSILTPGYLSLYIDDVSLKLIEGSDPSICDSPINCKAYVPIDANAKKSTSVCLQDINPKFIKTSATAVPQEKPNIWLIVGLAGGILLIGSLVLTAVIIVKKKRRLLTK